MPPKTLPSFVRHVFDLHRSYWDKRMPEMRRLRNLYMTRFWQEGQDKLDAGLVETARAYELVESNIASLFTKSPAVVIRPDLRNRGDAGMAQLVTNEYLAHPSARETFDRAMRFSFLYGAGFVKLFARGDEAPDPLQRVGSVAVQPWNVIVDEAAVDWFDQRYVGHIYYLSVEEASRRYKRAPNKFSPSRLAHIFEEDERGGVSPSSTGLFAESGAEGAENVVLVVEFYDMLNDNLVIWSPHYQNGEEFVSASKVRLSVGGGDEGAEPETQTFHQIPFRTATDRPVVPIIPCILSADPDYPLRGYAMLRRVEDQIREFNLVRTAQAQSVRRAARQWLVQKGSLDDEAISKLVSGQDGEVIEVDLPAGQDLRGLIVPVPHEETRTELQRYAVQVDEDLQRGTVLAPFTRGEATKATATEVQALAAYSATEVGRMARVRDSVIERTSRVYLVMLSVLMGDEPQVLYVGKKSTLLNPEELEADFAIYAQEAGSSPMAESVKKQEFISSIPLLQSLGVDNKVILKHVVKLLDLPEDMLPSDTAGTGGDTGSAPASLPASEAPAEQIGVGGAGATPSPESIQAVLPEV